MYNTCNEYANAVCNHRAIEGKRPMNHTTTTTQPTADEITITSIIDQWSDERTSRSDERDERTAGAGLDSASLMDMFNMFGSVA